MPLIKMALDAKKARQLARVAGIVPHPGSAWKWALRNVRDGRGDLLQGRALAEAKERIGKLPNNAYQAIASTSRKQKPSIEIGGLFAGNQLAKVHVGTTDALSPELTALISESSHRGAHTHPTGDQRFSSLQDIRNTRNQHKAFYKEQGVPENPEMSAWLDEAESETKNGTNLLKGKWKAQDVNVSPADLEVLEDRLLRHPGKAVTENIIAPLTHMEGVHHLRSGKEFPRNLKSIYFQNGRS